MAWSAAVTYCNDLVHGGHADWRLPDISELISLIRGCQDGFAIDSTITSLCQLFPDGCAVNGRCSKTDRCHWCSSLSGPGAAGCYRDPLLTGECEYSWSSTSYVYSDEIAWYLHFNNAQVLVGLKSIAVHARCVRGEP